MERQSDAREVAVEKDAVGFNFLQLRKNNG
jgi:hypothetical protein